jgi:glycosyltransferase involved in cell wall biosynthesis
LKNPLVSIFIPAYNNPSYTKKTIQSIINQSYRPLEILLFDDCSPNSLIKMYEDFNINNTDLLNISYFRNNFNLGPDNHILGFDKCNGKYVVNMPHDDWWVDDNFLSETVELMEKDTECNLCAANSIIEFTEKKMINLSPYFNSPLKWNTLNGKDYISILGNNGIGHQAWSGIIFNRDVAKKLGAFHPPFNITVQMGLDLKIIPDEFFAFQFLLSSIGNIAITDKVVSIRGNPKSSFVNSRKNEWAKSIGLSSFILHYNIYISNLQGKYSKAVKKAALRTLFHNPPKKVSFRIWKYYNFSFKVLILMFLLYTYGLLESIYVFRYKIAYFFDLLRVIFKIIIKKEARIHYFKKYILWEKK